MTTTATARAAIDLNNAEGVTAAIKRAFSHIKPPPRLNPSEYAEENIRIPAGNAIPGPVRFRNSPYQREVLDMTANPTCHRITLIWGAQTGKSQTQLMAMGYFIDHDPQSMMMMQPSQGDLNTWLASKFDPMVDSTPTLLEKMATPRGRDGVNNKQMKSYPGGFLMFAWSGSPKTMRGRSAPKIFADETDGYEHTSEGHPVSLLWQRAATFGDQRLLFETSTPTIKGASHIETAYIEGDQRRWYCDCPECGHSQYLKWSQVQWQKDEAGQHLPETAGYVCEGCGVLWDDADRYAAIRAGKWVPKKPWRGHASYHLPELASCFRRLRDIVQSFLEKKAQGDLQTFVNVSLAETWEETGDTVNDSELYRRREKYPAPVPAGVLVLTCAVDVQDDRLEIGVEGWAGPVGTEENWKIDYKVFRGDPAKADLWRQLDDFLYSTYETEWGVKLPIACTVIDSGGHFTQQVYAFVKPREGRRIFAIKGKSQSGAPIVSRPTRSNLGKVNLFMIGTDTAKQTIYGRLRNTEPGPGYVHFPIGPLFDEEYFSQLAAETCVTRFIKGFPVREWKKTRPRNEALDIAVYNVAALQILNPNFSKLADRIAKPVKDPEPEPEKPVEILPERAAKKQAKTRRRPARRGGYINSWR